MRRWRKAILIAGPILLLAVAAAGVGVRDVFAARSANDEFTRKWERARHSYSGYRFEAACDGINEYLPGHEHLPVAKQGIRAQFDRRLRERGVEDYLAARNGKAYFGLIDRVGDYINGNNGQGLTPVQRGQLKRSFPDNWALAMRAGLVAAEVLTEEYAADRERLRNRARLWGVIDLSAPPEALDLPRLDEGVE